MSTRNKIANHLAMITAGEDLECRHLVAALETLADEIDALRDQLRAQAPADPSPFSDGWSG